MNNFIFKSPRRLVKNSSIPDWATVVFKLNTIQTELRHQRSEHKDILRMINRLLVDEHLQMQVDKYFDHDSEDTPEPSSRAETEDLD